MSLKTSPRLRRALIALAVRKVTVYQITVYWGFFAQDSSIFSPWKVQTSEKHSGCHKSSCNDYHLIITDIKSRPAWGLLPAFTWLLPAARKGLACPAPWLPVAALGQPSPAPASPSLWTPWPVHALGERTPGTAAPKHCQLTLVGGKPESGTKCN